MDSGPILAENCNNRILLSISNSIQNNMEYLIEHNQTPAKGHRGKCLSKNDVKQGNLIKKGGPRRTTASLKKHNIEEMQSIAKDRGGWCLSKKYASVEKNLKWQCGKCDHIWDAKPANIIWNNQWCPKCGGNQRLTIEEMNAIAKSRGGKCLSKKYINTRTKLKWQCGDFKHIWYAIPDSVKRGSWCPVCARIKASKNKKRNKNMSIKK